MTSYVDITIALINAGANLNTLDSFGLTPLDYGRFINLLDLKKKRNEFIFKL